MMKTQVGSLFNSFGYVFAFNFDSSNFVPFSQVCQFVRMRVGVCGCVLACVEIGGRMKIVALA